MTTKFGMLFPVTFKVRVYISADPALALEAETFLLIETNPKGVEVAVTVSVAVELAVKVAVGVRDAVPVGVIEIVGVWEAVALGVIESVGDKVYVALSG